MASVLDVSDPAAVPRLLYTRNEGWASDVVNNPYTADFFPRHAEGQSPKVRLTDSRGLCTACYSADRHASDLMDRLF